MSLCTYVVADVQDDLGRRLRGGLGRVIQVHEAVLVDGDDFVGLAGGVRNETELQGASTKE